MPEQHESMFSKTFVRPPRDQAGGPALSGSSVDRLATMLTKPPTGPDLGTAVVPAKIDHTSPPTSPSPAADGGGGQGFVWFEGEWAPSTGKGNDKAPEAAMSGRAVDASSSARPADATGSVPDFAAPPVRGPVTPLLAAAPVSASGKSDRGGEEINEAETVRLGEPDDRSARPAVPVSLTERNPSSMTGSRRLPRRTKGLTDQDTQGIVGPAVEFQSDLADIFDQLWVRIQRRMTGGSGGQDDDITTNEFQIRHGSIQSLVVTSWNPGEGASSVALGLAARASAACQGEVVLIDTDLARRGLTISAGLSDRAGLQEVMSGVASLDQVLVNLQGSHVWFLPAGRQAALESVAADNRVQQIVTLLEDRFRYAIYDTPSLRDGVDAYRWGRFVINSVLVVHAGRVRRQTVEHAASAMRLQGMDVLGTVLNRRVDPIPGWLYPYL